MTMRHERNVLLIAFHFPPFQGSSGVQRTLRFAQHLPKFGWRATVLSIHSRAYESRLMGTGNEIPSELKVYRAFGLDAARHLSIWGRYPRSFSLPDRWATWRYGAVSAGKQIISKEKIDCIWS